MRELKFRIWDTFNGVMMNQEEDRYADSLSKIWVDYDILLEGDNDPIMMQFTGLKDKSGKEIYEGDILKTDYDVGNVSVVFAEFKGKLKGYPSNIDELEIWGWCVNHPSLGLQPLDDSFYKNFHVIGNIYENPELIQNDIHT
ncbi:YopX family protein [Gaetbulibacter sp. PBL-D1]|uniref:YopX family protein n=1 Tax=Gaetbulibacter sp. PBL-D1 TaxID=3422594 RepID=UPI003D2F07ED